MANTQKNNTNTNPNFSDVQAVIRADVGEEAAIALGLGDADDIVLQGLRSLASHGDSGDATNNVIPHANGAR